MIELMYERGDVQIIKATLEEDWFFYDLMYDGVTVATFYELYCAVEYSVQEFEDVKV